MDSVPTAETVLQGVYTLYNSRDSTEQEKASKWLEEFQKSIHSWNIADQLLQQKHDLHSCYFAAQTMRNKIQNSFHELPPTAHDSLRESLLQHISHITNETNPIIITQLCLALADLSLLMSSWHNPVCNLMERFSTNPNSMLALIVILTLIPEEINSRYLRLGANRRQEILRDLETNSNNVANFLQGCLMNSNQNEGLQIKILKCFNAWISINVFKLPDITDNLILSFSFTVLTNQNIDARLHDTAADCLCALLQCIECGNSNDLVEQKIFSGILQLKDVYHLSVKHEDLDKTINFCRIFTVLAESYLNKLITNSCCETPHYSIKSLDLVLDCVAHHDFEVAEITFNMWYKLSEFLYQRNNEDLTKHFKPHIERLISELYRHCQMDPDHDGLIEDGESFKEFRHKVSELIKDVIFIISSTNCFKQMFIVLQSPNTTWESSEAALFIMENVARNILPDENEVVHKVIEAILNLPDTCHIAIRFTSINILGELCDWIEFHPESLQPILNFLLQALQQKSGLATAAANALQSICSSCKKLMLCEMKGLIEIARCLDTFDIQTDSAIGLIKGISLIVGRLESNEISNVMRELCAFQTQSLRHLLENDITIEKGKRSDPVFWLDRLAAIYRHVNPPHNDNEVNPCACVIIENWDILSRGMDKYQADSKIMERIVRCIRYAIRCIKKQALPILKPLVEQIISVYSVHKHSCLLYLGSILVDEFAKEKLCIQGLLNMLQAFIEPTFTILQRENGLRDHPDTVDDFFRLSARFIQRSPVEFLQSSLVSPIFQCALLACTLDHRDANTSVMKFFCNILSNGRSDNDDNMKQLVHQILTSNGDTLVMNLIYASVFCLHSNMLADVADVFLEMKQINAEILRNYLKTALDALPKKNSGGCVTATDFQLNDFVDGIMRADTAKQMTHAFQEFARLYR